jgi:drug/metabolite transporter (DMT)-like permease
MMDKKPKMDLFYFSAVIAILGAIGYQVLIKLVPTTLNPFISNLAVYFGVLVLCIVALPFFSLEGGFVAQVRQLSWIQIGLAVAVLFIELGFLLMYRAGWNLSTGNVVTGVIINLALIAMGLLIFNEKLTTLNMFGVVLCIVGVGLINYRQ